LLADPAGDALARMKLLDCDEAPAPGAAGWAAAPPPEPLAACRQPVIVTVLSLCAWLAPVLGVLGGCAGEAGGCCAATPTASAALSIVPKMI
jgi:hypothetical protein